MGNTTHNGTSPAVTDVTELEDALENISREVRDFIFGVSLSDLHHWARCWALMFGEVDEVQPVGVTHQRDKFDAECQKAGLPKAGGVAGAGRVLANESFEFGMIFGLALGQAVARERTFSEGVAYDREGEEPLSAGSALQCWVDAAHEADRILLISEEARGRIERRKVYGQEGAAA